MSGVETVFKCESCVNMTVTCRFYVGSSTLEDLHCESKRTAMNVMATTNNHIEVYVQCWKFHMQLLYVYLDFGAIHSWNVSCSSKSPKNPYKNPYFVIQGHPRSFNSVAIQSKCMNSY